MAQKGITMGQARTIILQDYLAWMKQGRQDGVINLIGDAGIGKTEILYQIADELREKHGATNAQVVELFVSASMDPESVAGTPAPVMFNMGDGKEQVPALQMHYRKELLEPLAKGKGPILFIDEIGREARHMRPLLLKLLDSCRSLAGLEMKDMYIIVAGNPADADHHVDNIQEDAAVSSRLVDVPVKCDVKEVADYFYQWTASHRQVADFLLENANFLTGRDSDNNSASKYHCPRSWFNLAMKIHIHGRGTEDEPGRLADASTVTIGAGTIGAQAFSTYRTFVTRKAPITVKQILKGDFKTKIRAVPPSVMQGLKHHLANTPLTDKQADNVSNFLGEISADLASALTRDPKRLHSENLTMLAARGFFAKFVKRVHRTRRGAGTTK